MNKIILLGKVKTLPEIKKTREGRSILKFKIETLKEYEGKSYLTTHQIAVFQEPLIEYAERNLKVNTVVFVEGELVYSSIEKEGIKRFITEIRVVSLKTINNLSA